METSDAVHPAAAARDGADLNARYWVWLAPVDSVPLREGRAVSVGGRDIALFNLGDRFLAVDNRCPHKGGPLSDGIVAGETVVCPLHGWRINLVHGGVDARSGVGCVAIYPVRVDNGVVVIGLPAAEIGPNTSEAA
jgi:nitrite reductase (NADH) small subunit